MIRNDTDYALRMVVHLAKQSPRGVAASELSDRLGVPHSFAQKILRKLATAEILQTRLGRRGGFRLGRQPGGVSLMDVIAAIQGPLLLNRCMGSPTVCSRQPSCRISASLRPFQDKLAAFLCSTSLSDILGGPARSIAKTTKSIRRPGIAKTKERSARSDMGA